jgi:sugar phosphate isomerase/epimerase
MENIDYPFSWVDILAEEFGLKICLDLGHLILQKANITKSYNRYQDRVTMMHLHGIGHRDHKALTLIPHDDWLAITGVLNQFRGGLSIEVFSLEDLRLSLNRMAEICG